MNLPAVKLKLKSEIMINLTGKTSTPASTPAEPIIALDGGKSGYVLKKDFIGAIDKFDQKFGAPPYLFGHWRAGTFFASRHPAITLRIVDEVFERAGGLKKIIQADARAKLAEILAQSKDLNEKLLEYNWRNATQLYIQQRNSAAGLKPGGKVALSETMSRDQILESITSARAGLHENIRKLSDEVFAVVAPICGRVRDAAREVAIELDKNERATAQKYEQEFTPSPQLSAFCYFAAVTANSPIRNYVSGNGFLSPDLDLEAAWRSEIVVPAVPAADGQRLYTFGRMPGEQSEEQRHWLFKKTVTDEEQKKRHADKVAELNAFNDSIRNQPQK